MDFVIELVSGAACAGAQRVTALNHEAVDHAVEDRAVIQRTGGLLAGRRIGPFALALRKGGEVLDGVGRLLGEKLESDIAHIGMNCCFHDSIVPDSREIGTGFCQVFPRLRCMRRRKSAQ